MQLFSGALSRPWRCQVENFTSDCQAALPPTPWNDGHRTSTASLLRNLQPQGGVNSLISRAENVDLLHMLAGSASHDESSAEEKSRVHFLPNFHG